MRQRSPFVTFILVLLALWVVISILGLVVRALVFLTFVGVAALILTAAWGGYRAGRRR